MSNTGKRKRFVYSDDSSSSDDSYVNPFQKKQRLVEPTTITVKEDDQPVEIDQFRVSKESKLNLSRDGITTLYPVQVNTFDYVYDGRDVIGRARTGTGKTLSFSLPVIEKLLATKHYGLVPAVLCLAPTRELAKQVQSVMKTVLGGRLSTLCVYGGVHISKQQRSLRAGIDIIVGTPGRVIDLIDRGNLDLSQIKYFILDEADDMLNMGFLKDIKKIFSYVPIETVQTLLYSATMPKWVKKIAEEYLKPDYVIIDLVGDGDEKKTADGIEHYSMDISYEYGKRLIALEKIMSTYLPDGGKTMIFCDMQRNCTKLAGTSFMKKKRCEMLHGGIPQQDREVTLKKFRDGHFDVLICTNVAARGLDIDDIKLVIQFYIPESPETYVHRSGRTGRAGNTGICVTFFDSKARGEKNDMLNIESYANFQFQTALEGVEIDYTAAQKYHSKNKRDGGGRGRGGRGRGGRGDFRGGRGGRGRGKDKRKTF
eukprot:TRINITY_DN2673_c0_g2_i1.p1 TRINITY_DN2673_c0_g2~~TRINITY_DN2673_c0_g2_i1.p1  ORF type:complete len:482 (+),score=117.92 TRINITY_DN2673_c0_g2_i1:75-1520(+)